MLPAAASLRKQGANKGATSAFLVSTPESGVDSIAITYALLDPMMTVIRPVAAFVTAMTAGLAENLLFWEKKEVQPVVDRSCKIDNCCDGIDCPDELHRRHHSLWEKIRAGMRYGYREVWGDIAVWFFAGVGLAGLITTFIPQELLETFLGGGFGSMVIMLAAGIPLYICATASTPIAAALILKGVSPGAALVFLLVGPATNLTSLSVLVKILGKRSTALYLTVIALCAVFFGLVVDYLYVLAGISPQAILGEASDLFPPVMKYAAVVILLLLSIRPVTSFCKKLFGKKQAQTVFVSDFPQMPSAGSSKCELKSEEEKKKCDCS
ncbi:hypothetical protein SAMN05660330_01474 [Desulforhopalus singaporensis]|uniref:Permease n=1 Tax=Desulforhopalus singaporensis TaxID=91360 RepID=A0A1H0NWG2_9BACT|nr:SO_0444 family Cu/Zn efflux transporter [Desulforhopalus singaporensis]SDO96969.1 hypothetical protein SAMN05660330_01474 [Desulforhopalus singaporensis]